VNLDNVRRDDWIVGGLALLLVLDLLILPWFSLGGTVTVGSASISYGADLTGTDAPDGWLGILAVLASLFVLIDMALERFSPQTQVPAVKGSRVQTRFVLAAAAAIFMALKFIFHLGNFSDLGYGFWLGVILAGGLVYTTMQARQGSPLLPPTRPSEPRAAPPTGPGGPPTGPSVPPTEPAGPPTGSAGPTAF
jgi:hypothetical protein